MRHQTGAAPQLNVNQITLRIQSLPTQSRPSTTLRQLGSQFSVTLPSLLPAQRGAYDLLNDAKYMQATCKGAQVKTTAPRIRTSQRIWLKTVVTKTRSPYWYFGAKKRGKIQRKKDSLPARKSETSSMTRHLPGLEVKGRKLQDLTALSPATTNTPSNVTSCVLKTPFCSSI
jgi:hypothetical protein